MSKIFNVKKHKLWRKYQLFVVVAIGGVLLLVNNGAQAADFARSQVIAPDTPSNGTRLGESYFSGQGVDVDGDFMVATGRQSSTEDDRVYIFKRVGGTWQDMQTITPSDWQSGDQFGQSVAIDGNTIVVGALGDTNGSTSSGSVYVYDYDSDLDEWLQTQKLISTTFNGNWNKFGGSVDIEGDTILIGAPGYQATNTNNGKGGISIWTRSGLTWTVGQEVGLSSEVQFSRFGAEVKLDGTHVIASGSLQTKILAWEYSGGSLTGPSSIVRSGVSSGSFLDSIEVKNGWLAVPSRETSPSSVYKIMVYEHTGSAWTQRQNTATTINNQINDVAFTDDLSQLIVGHYLYTSGSGSASGAVTRLEKSGSTYSEVQTLPVTPDSYNSGANAQFGASVVGADNEFYIAAPYTTAITNGATTAGNINLYSIGDGTPPEVSITSTATDPTNSAFEVTFIFTENVTGFTAGDIVVEESGVEVGGKVSGFITDSASVYRATITPTASNDFTVQVSVPEATLTDIAGTANIGSSFSIDYDDVKPNVAVALTGGDTSPTNQDDVNLRITFSEDVSNFVSGDISVTNGSITAFNPVSASVYDVVVEPSADGTTTVSVSAGVASDAATNTNNASSALNVVFDRVGPTPSFSTAIDPTNANPFDVTISFDETQTAFNSELLSVAGATIDETQSSGNDIIVTLIPDAEGTVSLTSQAGMVTDALGNPSTAAGPFTVDYAVFGPTITVTAPTNPTNLSPMDFTVQFSESVTGFDGSDAVITNGSLAGFSSIDSDTYTVSVTPSSNFTTVSVNVPYGVAQNGLSENNLPSNTASADYDAEQPTPTITVAGTYTNNSPVSFSVNFSEDVTGLSAGDFSVTNGTASNLQSISASSYTVNVTPAAEGLVTLQLPSSTVNDTVGNSNTASNTSQITYDTTAPTASVSSSASDPTITSPIPVTITFDDEILSNISGGDVAVTNGALASAPVKAGDNLSVSFSVAPTANGAVTVQLAAAATTDRAGNPNQQSNLFSILYDPQPISVTITAESANPTNASPLSYLVDFTAEPTSFDSGDINVTNGSVLNLTSLSATQYRFTVSPSVADDLVAVQVPAGVVNDSIGNANLSSNAVSIDYDSVAPAPLVSLSASSPNNLDTTTLTYTFTEDVSGLDISDFSTNKGSLSNFQSISALVYSIDLLQTTDGVATVTLASGTANDVAGNGNAQHQTSVERDTSAPIGTVDSGSFITSTPEITGTVDDTSATVTVHINGNDLSATNNGDGTWVLPESAYGSVVIPNGTYGVTATFTDTATNSDTSIASDITVNVFYITPTFTSTSPANINTSPINVSVDFDVAVVDFDPSDLVLTNASVQNFSGSGMSYSFELVPSGQGTVVASLPFGTVHDVSDHVNLAAQISRTYDTESPDATISGPSSTAINTAFTTTISLSQASSDFDVSDITIVNGSLSGFAPQGANSYSVLVTPAFQGLVSLQVLAGAFTDAATNSNNASNTFSITYDSVSPLNPTVDSQSTYIRTPTITGTYDDGDFNELRVTVGGVTYISGSSANLSTSGGVWTLKLSSLLTPLDVGTYNVAVTQFDAAGNSSQDLTTGELVINAYPGISGTVDIQKTSDSTPGLSGSVDDTGATVAVKLAGKQYNATNNGDGSWELADNIITPALSNGVYDVELVLTNGPRTGMDVTIDELTIDSTKPTGTLSRIQTTNKSPRLFGTVDDPAANVKVVLLGTTYDATNNGDVTWELPLNSIAPPLEEGSYTAVLIITNSLNNEAVTVVRKAISVLGASTTPPPEETEEPTSGSPKAPEIDNPNTTSNGGSSQVPAEDGTTDKTDQEKDLEVYEEPGPEERTSEENQQESSSAIFSLDDFFGSLTPGHLIAVSLCVPAVAAFWWFIASKRHHDDEDEEKTKKT